MMRLGALILAVGIAFALATPLVNAVMAIPIVNLLLLIVFYGVIGSIAGRLVRGRDFSLVGNAILGFFGWMTGGLLVVLLGWWRLFDGGLISQFIVGVVGSIILIFLMHLIDRNFAR
jgi:uncharacterized membrane protein YeaQ/YmgE (transglycosylase-associated protein family)